ncbi:hypothetical protein D1B33_06740 [Lysinibacillus yapensis]|uniref:Uncharacterized protein n=1 Tax=Ureibacillus yapensis TaxID=2304605 RepID=A0A396SHM8_9BACL|nr:hypothetical protein [Lysinibacillus yapensis]RHW38567.1 hypothetical protein D1B33_06740 [Lysinibacillus yapensis]
MFLQALFKQQKKEEIEISAAEKFLTIVRELLNKELPEHRSHHHILYTANTRLEIFRNLLTHHRSQSNVHQKLGNFHSEMYEQIGKKVSELQCLVDGYMELNIDIKQMNHRLHFYHDKIHYLYENYTQFQDRQYIEEYSTFFWQALKMDALEIIRKVL